MNVRYHVTNHWRNLAPSTNLSCNHQLYSDVKHSFTYQEDRIYIIVPHSILWRLNAHYLRRTNYMSTSVCDKPTTRIRSNATVNVNFPWFTEPCLRSALVLTTNPNTTPIATQTKITEKRWCIAYSYISHMHTTDVDHDSVSGSSTRYGVHIRSHLEYFSGIPLHEAFNDTRKPCQAQTLKKVCLCKKMLHFAITKTVP